MPLSFSIVLMEMLLDAKYSTRFDQAASLDRAISRLFSRGI